MQVRRTKEFEAWLASLSDETIQARVAQRLQRVEREGYFGVTRSVGGAVREMKLDFGPGYRIYYHQRQQIVTFLLHGGHKRTQEKDIAKAQDILRRLGVRPNDEGDN